MPRTTKLLNNGLSYELRSESMRPETPIRFRRAATILEVLFAIFVVIVGLMGIASLLPLAGRNAQESNDATNALTQGRIWENEFFARGMNNPNENTEKAVGFNWVYRGDASAPAGFGIFNKTSARTLNLSDPAQTILPRQRTWQQLSVCIDPLFMSEPNVVDGFTNGTSRLGAFRPAVFPYYEHGYDPTEDSALETGASPWTDQPRMLRVSLGGGTGIPIPQSMARELFQSTDDLAMVKDDSDKTIPASRSFSFTAGLGGTGGPNKQSLEGDYSWLATLSPEFDSSPSAATNDYVLSIVIMRKRDLGFPSAATPPAVGSETSKPQGERLVWVYPLSGDFVAGNSGRARLIANSATNDQVQIGDWIMLGKHFAVHEVPPIPPATQTGYSVFRWFRIIAADPEPRRASLADVVPDTTGADPFGGSGTEVWARDVVLEGTDWSFSGGVAPLFSAAGAQIGSVAAPTTGTLMSNVITVIERNVHVD